MAKAVVKYYEEDKEFRRMEDCAEKTELAVSRMENPYNLDDETHRMYADWLEKTGPKTVPEFIDSGKVAIFPLLVRHRVIRKANINKMVDYAQEKRKMDILSYLLNVSNDFRMHPKTMDVAPKFKPGKAPASQKMPASEDIRPGQIVWLGIRPMPWVVLDKKEDRVQIISKYAFDCQAYNNTFYKKKWNDCALAKWLNRDFFNSFFSDVEKEIIGDVYIDDEDNLHFEKPGENTPSHKMYVLSMEEATRFFPTAESRRARVTLLGKRKILWQSFDVYAHWWLRTEILGTLERGQSHVLANGEINRYGGIIQSNGFDEFYDHYGVRPAMCISLK